MIPPVDDLSRTTFVAEARTGFSRSEIAQIFRNSFENDDVARHRAPATKRDLEVNAARN